METQRETELKKVIEAVTKRVEDLNERYMEAERFLIKLNWFERLFFSRKLTRFLKSRTDKYDF